MKTILKLTALFALLIGFAACNNDEDSAPAALPVTPANLNGVWQLTEQGGLPLGEETYCYIKFNRKEQTFEMYHNFDSMYARLITGNFKLTQDPYLGDLISGNYDFGNGAWNHDYIITNLLESGVMTWTAKDDATDVSLYTRCAKVPDDIVAEARRGNEE